ncbi:MAG: adenylosuccinate lyase family protein [Candidatus Eremiobacteraeota bacterium]|nr:adenylosuccinate lyase family protein [Candidatus Eremiobacteraeota bacterium]
MRDVFCVPSRLQAMLDVEIALARAEARVGVIPAAAADAIAAAADVGRLDIPAIVAGTQRVGYPVVPLTKQLAELAGADAGGYVHWGATTQDILDTATVLQLRRAFALLEADLTAVIRALSERALLHRDDVMAGRTHLQHALPVTFGYTCALWLAPLIEHRSRLSRARAAVESLQFGGAVGTLASLGERGRDVALALGAELGLRVPEAPWHVDRSAFADAACAVGLVCGSLAKFATDVALLMQTDVAEVAEPYEPGRGGSSTMPQKRNPIASEYVLATARGVHALVPVMLLAMAGDHERSTGPWQSEELALSQIFVLASATLAHARAVATGMTVDVARMRRNLETTGGLIVSESVAMSLAASLGSGQAHNVVDRACALSLESGITLRDALLREPAVSAVCDAEAIDKLLDPLRYTGDAGGVVDRVVKAARTALSD